MENIQSIVLGIVQGLTEFLPISSSAHLVLTPYFFKWEDPGLSYDVALHVGTLLAVLVYFWKDWLEIIRNFFKRSGVRQTATLPLLFYGSLPAAVIGFLFEKQAEHAFRSPLVIACTLSVFGILLWYWDRTGSKVRDIAETSWRDAVIIGMAQAIAIIPGVSRSGVTVTAALALGLTRSSAIRFSFLLSAPITAGAILLKAKYIFQTITAGGAAATAVGLGLTTSLLSGLFALGLLGYIVKGRTFNGFVAYRLCLSFIIIIVIIFR